MLLFLFYPLLPSASESDKLVADQIRDPALSEGLFLLEKKKTASALSV